MRRSLLPLSGYNILSATTVVRVVQPSDVSVGELFTRGAAGDVEAWAELTDRLMPAIWRVVRSFGFDRFEAEDLAQTVWLRMIDRADTVREPERIAGWVARTARNEAVAMIGRASRERPSDTIDLRESVDGQPGKDLEQGETLELMWAGFLELGERCQRLLRLLVAKVPYQDICDLLDMQIGSIGPTRQRCLKELRATAGGKQVVENP